MSSDAKLCSVKIQGRPDPDLGREVFMRAEVDGQIQRVWADLEKLKKLDESLDGPAPSPGNDPFDDESEGAEEERVGAFVWNRVGCLVRIIERAVEEDRSRDERGAIELTKADLTNLARSKGQ